MVINVKISMDVTRSGQESREYGRRDPSR
jgi:hypothetical protein